jgi:CubicO group peptidase (beta-lactamase class C family)
MVRGDDAGRAQGGHDARMQPLGQHPGLTALVEAQAAEHGIPGLAVAVLHGGATHVATLGVTSVDDPLPVDLDTLFMIGSTTKTLTGTAVMRLVDEGAVALADRVVDHLPDFALADRELTRRVTVGQLLNHTAGWRGDDQSDEGFGDDALQRSVAKIRDEPQEFPPGAHVSYNNAAVGLAGRLLEVLTGSSYETAVSELVLAPLGLTSTYFFPWETAQRRAAVGHVVVGGVARAVPEWPLFRAMHPSGGAISSLRDQVGYARYHLDGTTPGQAPVRETTRRQMQQPTSVASSRIDGVGVSWLLSRHGRLRIAAHGGNISNLQTSAFTLAPDHGLAVGGMAITKAGAEGGAAVLEWGAQELLGEPPRAALPTQPLTAQLRREYVGSYDLGPWWWEVSAQGDRLFAQMRVPDDAPEAVRAAFAAAPTELLLVGPDQVATAGSPAQTAGDFVRDATGRVRWFRIGLRMARRQETGC